MLDAYARVQGCELRLWGLGVGTVSTMLEKERLVRTAICVPIDADEVTACPCTRRESKSESVREIDPARGER